MSMPTSEYSDGEPKWHHEAVRRLVERENAKKDLRVKKALDVLITYGQIDGDWHKAWVIDQAVRALTGDEYENVIRESCAGEDGPETYGWDIGIAP